MNSPTPPLTDRYDSKCIKALATLYDEWLLKLQSGGIWGLMWRAVNREVPGLLDMLDKDPEAQEKLTEALLKVSEMMLPDLPPAAPTDNGREVVAEGLASYSLPPGKRIQLGIGTANAVDLFKELHGQDVQLAVMKPKAGESSQPPEGEGSEPAAEIPPPSEGPDG